MNEKNALISSHTVAQAESDDLARFEGEGGREASPPDPVDVPLVNGIRSKLRWKANEANEKKLTP
jgi:hypothetical protein